VEISPTDREHEICIESTVITRATLEGWINRQNIEVVRRLRPKSVTINAERVTVSHEQEKPIAALPYYGHQSEGLEFVDDAIKQFWSTYDPDDPTTAPRKDDVIEYLRSRGATKNVAETVDKILRPENARTAHLRNRRPPTRESQ